MTAARWRAAAYGLGAALVVALAVLVVLLVQGDDGPAAGKNAGAETLLQAEQDAEKAAREAAVHLTTYDYRTLDTDFDWAVTAGTKKFRDYYVGITDRSRAAFARLKVQAEGSVDLAAATATDADHVTVLLFVDQTLVSEDEPGPTLATPRISMTMVRSGGSWLVDAVSLREMVGQEQ